MKMAELNLAERQAGDITIFDMIGDINLGKETAFFAARFAAALAKAKNQANWKAKLELSDALETFATKNDLFF